MRVQLRPLLLLFGVLAGCGAPDPHTQDWKPVDAQALLDALGSPTGEFDDLEALLNDLEEVLGPLLDTQELLDAIRSVAADLSDVEDAGVADAGPLRPTPPPPQERGTRFYLLLSCPGPDGDDLSFGHGDVRIDTPTLADLTDESLGEAGDFLLSYHDCQAKVAKVNGSSPGYYDLTRETFLLDYDVQYEDLATGKKLEYRGPLLYVDGGLDVLLGPADDSYRIAIDARPATTLTITGATESLQCTIDADALSLSCD